MTDTGKSAEIAKAPTALIDISEVKDHVLPPWEQGSHPPVPIADNEDSHVSLMYFAFFHNQLT